jgi:acrylyl-CoA reductase (NADPH)
MCPVPLRQKAWLRLASDLPMGKLDKMIETAALADLPGLGGQILAGKVRGRVVVDTTR